MILPPEVSESYPPFLATYKLEVFAFAIASFQHNAIACHTVYRVPSLTDAISGRKSRSSSLSRDVVQTLCVVWNRFQFCRLR